MDVAGNHEVPALPPVFRLGAFQVSTEEGSIAGPDGVHRLEPRVFAVLLYLVARHGHVVAREELFSQIWHGVVVGDDALHYSVSQIRKLFGDDARHPHFLETLPRRGYRWLLRVKPPTVRFPWIRAVRTRWPVVLKWPWWRANWTAHAIGWSEPTHCTPGTLPACTAWPSTPS